jgi:hypothetical protein
MQPRGEQRHRGRGCLLCALDAERREAEREAALVCEVLAEREESLDARRIAGRGHVREVVRGVLTDQTLRRVAECDRRRVRPPRVERAARVVLAPLVVEAVRDLQRSREEQRGAERGREGQRGESHTEGGGQSTHTGGDRGTHRERRRSERVKEGQRGAERAERGREKRVTQREDDSRRTPEVNEAGTVRGRAQCEGESTERVKGRAGEGQEIEERTEGGAGRGRRREREAQ